MIADYLQELLANLTLNHKDYGDYYQIWEKVFNHYFIQFILLMNLQFDFIFGLVDLIDCKEARIDYLLNLFAGLKQDNIHHAGKYFRPDLYLPLYRIPHRSSTHARSPE